MIKRTFDLLVAIVTLVALLPVLLVLIWLVKVRLGAPVFFCQIFFPAAHYWQLRCFPSWQENPWLPGPAT